MYTAAVLNNISSQLLRWIMRGTVNLESQGYNFGNNLPHHMTINMGKLDVSLNSKSILSCPALMKVSELRFDHDLGICAAPVDEAIALRMDDSDPIVQIQTINEQPHITICLKPGVRPVTSNELLAISNAEVVKLDEVYELSGTIQEIH